MEIVGISIFIILLIFSWISIFFGLFGTLLILIFSFVYSFLTNFSIIRPKVLLALVFFYLAGELFDYIFIALGAKKFGATNKAIFGGILGGIIGAGLSLASLGIGFFPLVLLGIFLGTFLVEFFQKGDLAKSFRAGIGSLIGRFSATIFKVLLGLAMVFIIAKQIFSNFH
jgi:hypothetical protein